jgi:curved DNA-binding protein
LQVSPNCSAKALESAFHYLAKMYHPDHSTSPDVEKLTRVIEAHKVLKEASTRAEYDLLYATETGFVFDQVAQGPRTGGAPVSDADAHNEMLMILYTKKRQDAGGTGVARFVVQQALACSDDVFEFHIWYLKEKGFIRTAEDGTLAITIEGVDRVISHSRAAAQEKLMIAQSRQFRDTDEA